MRIQLTALKAVYVAGGIVLVAVVENYVFSFLPGLAGHILDALAQAAFVLSATALDAFDRYFANADVLTALNRELDAYAQR